MAAEKEISVAGTVTTNEWSDRAVVVTGAAGGIGKGIVAALLEAGAKLVTVINWSTRSAVLTCRETACLRL